MLNKLLLLIFTLFFFISTAYADDMTSPVGQWITISYKTGERISIVKIWEQNGMLYGKVMKIFPGPNRGFSDRCEQCEGDLKGKPIIGMTVLWDFTQGDNGRWVNGHALDPHTGEVYRGSMVLLDNGKQLELTGYWGIFWHSQTWIRDVNNGKT